MERGVLFALAVGAPMLAGYLGSSARDRLLVAGVSVAALGLALFPALVAPPDIPSSRPEKPRWAQDSFGLLVAGLLGIGTGALMAALLHGAGLPEALSLAAYGCSLAILFAGTGALLRTAMGAPGAVLAYALAGLWALTLPIAQKVSSFTGSSSTLLWLVLHVDPLTVVGESVLGADVLRHPYIYRNYPIGSTGPYLPAPIAPLCSTYAAAGVLLLIFGLVLARTRHKISEIPEIPERLDDGRPHG